MNTEEKKLKSIVAEVLKETVVPRFDKVDTKLEKLESQNKTIIGQVVQNSEDITILQENVKDVLLTEERIETAVEASIRRQDSLSIKNDQLSRRVLKLEVKKT